MESVYKIKILIHQIEVASTSQMSFENITQTTRHAVVLCNNLHDVSKWDHGMKKSTIFDMTKMTLKEKRLRKHFWAKAIACTT